MKGKAESAAQKAWFIVHDGLSPVNSAGGTSGGSGSSTIGTTLPGKLPFDLGAILR